MIDGVIKYAIEHTTETAPEFSDYKTLEALRSRLFTLGLIGVSEGVGYGNISLREKNSSAFFITATQTGELSSLTDDYYTYISDYDFSSFKVISRGRHRPSSEALSHAMIYQIDPQINCVIHIHSKALWNFMKESNTLATTAEYGTSKMADEIASLYTDRDPFKSSIFVMRGHEDGVMAFGRDVNEAELTLYSMIQKYLQSM
ncbi:MAG: class II aldolase/adducin family protein [Campylobacterota bacterium]